EALTSPPGRPDGRPPDGDRLRRGDAEAMASPPRRRVSTGPLAAHVIGTLGPPAARDLPSTRPRWGSLRLRGRRAAGDCRRPTATGPPCAPAAGAGRSEAGDCRRPAVPVP